jgi:ribonuclease BN (tRNA processing enzyme)
MMVQVVGGHSGAGPGFWGTSFMIDGKLLVDAGSVASGIALEEQGKIEWILISHAHLDHIKDLAFLADNCFGVKKKPFQIYTNRTVELAIRAHLLNNIIWPDFTQIPSLKKPILKFNEILIEKKFILGPYTIWAVLVGHPGDSMGFIVEKGPTALLFTQDTGPTEKIWELARKNKKIKAIFTEVSFPNSMALVAENSFHHTPKTLMNEIKKMPLHVPIFISHLKPMFQKTLLREIEELRQERIRPLQAENSTLVF